MNLSHSAGVELIALNTVIKFEVRVDIKFYCFHFFYQQHMELLIDSCSFFLKITLL